MSVNILQGGLNKAVVNVGCYCTYPAAPVAGDPCLFGNLFGVAECDEDANGITTLNTECIAELVVQGVDGSGNVAVTAGDIIYASAADPVVLSKIATGKRAGIAYGNKISAGATDTRTGTLVASGATTTTIRVLVGK